MKFDKEARKQRQIESNFNYITWWDHSTVGELSATPIMSALNALNALIESQTVEPIPPHPIDWRI